MQPKAQLQQPINKKTSNEKNSSQLIKQLGKGNKPLDTTYLYTPTQFLISNFLTTKKTIEDDLILTLKGITDIRNKPDTSVTQLREQLHIKKKQLQSIKRKLNKSCQQQIQVYDIMKKRIHRHQPQHHLSSLKTQNHSQNQPNLETSAHQNQLNYNLGSAHKNQVNNAKTEDSLKNSRRMFYLNLNKQITYFMVQQSVKMQQKLYVQQEKRAQKAAQQRKAQQQHQKAQEQHQKAQEQHQKAQEQHQKAAKTINQQQKAQHQKDDNNQPQIQVDGYRYLNESQMIEHEMRMIPDQQSEFNMEDDLLDLERFFQSEHFEMDYINTLTGIGRNMQQMEMKLHQKIESQKLPKQNELWITEKDLFKQAQFVQKLSNNNLSIEKKNSQMELEQPTKTQSHNKNHNHQRMDQNLSSFFEGQIQLQCMLYRRKHQISKDILSNNLQSINQFLYENSHMIKKYDSDLEFWVIICRAIDLIRTKNQNNEMYAIQIMRNKIMKMKGNVKDWHREELQKVTNMLIMEDLKVSTKPYLQRTEAAFREVFQQIYRLPDFSRFMHSLYTGALILKTPSCIEKEKQNPLICPLCNPLAEKVFKRIPLLTRNQSNLICRIDGSLMDQENYPVMLPSNQIYSLKGLEGSKKVIRQNVGKHVEQYYCKFTSTWYNKEQAKKVYLA